MTKNETRIFQPNLTCRFHLTGSPDNRLRNLTMLNKDEGVGICDEQIFQSYFNWSKEMIKSLKDTGAVPPKEFPTVDMMLSFSKSCSVFTLTAFCMNEDMQLPDLLFAIAVQNYAMQASKQLGFKLEGADSGQN
jgi:hypothetical protein